MKALEIIYYVFLVISLLYNIIITVVIKRSDKTKSTTIETGVEVNKGNNKKTKIPVLTTILSKLPVYMKMAEEFYNNLVNPSIKKTGSQKLEYVLEKIKVDCLTSGVDFAQNEQYIISKVEELIDLTKNVNSK